MRAASAYAMLGWHRWSGWTAKMSDGVVNVYSQFNYSIMQNPIRYGLLAIRESTDHWYVNHPINAWIPIWKHWIARGTTDADGNVEVEAKSDASKLDILSCLLARHSWPCWWRCQLCALFQRTTDAHHLPCTINPIIFHQMVWFFCASIRMAFSRTVSCT